MDIFTVERGGECAFAVNSTLRLGKAGESWLDQFQAKLQDKIRAHLPIRAPVHQTWDKSPVHMTPTLLLFTCCSPTHSMAYETQRFTRVLK